MNPDISDVDGACHCGAVRFHARLSDGLRSARRCNCSICRMRGAVMIYAPVDGFEITSGGDALTCYQFHSKVAKHYFCATCGVYTHHQTRAHPDRYAINAACIAGLSPYDFAEVVVVDGANHPKDTGANAFPNAGVLKFVATKP